MNTPIVVASALVALTSTTSHAQEPGMLRIAMCQTLCIDGDKEGNYARIERALARAKSAGARIACFPEMALLGWVNPEAHTRAEPIPGKDSERIGALARAYGLYICIGLAEKAGEDLYNAVILVSDRGQLLLSHRKINTLDDLMEPPYSRGESVQAVDTPLGKIGLLICADTFMGEWLDAMRDLAPDLVLVPYGWAAVQDAWPDHGQALLGTVCNVARAIGAPVVGTDGVGSIANGPWAGRTYGGHSIAADADGNVLAVAADRDVDVCAVNVPVRGLLEPIPADKTPDSAVLTVALLQMLPEGNDQWANWRKAEAYCRRAAAMGADVALMPEMWNIGYSRIEDSDIEGWRAQAVARDSDAVQGFARLAAELKVAIGVTYLEAWDGPPRNSLTLFDASGQEVLTYAKVHSCDFAFEAATTPGDAFPTAVLIAQPGPVRVGAMICFDREQPESARMLMLNGAEVVLVPNACGLDHLRLDQFKSRAFENAMAVAMTNYPAPKNNGQSIAFDAAGNLIVHAGEAEGIYLAPIALKPLRQHRQHTIWGHAFRRPHRYGALLQELRLPPFGRKNSFGHPFVPEER